MCFQGIFGYLEVLGKKLTLSLQKNRRGANTYMVIKGLRKGNCDFNDLRYGKEDIISTSNNQTYAKKSLLRKNNLHIPPDVVWPMLTLNSLDYGMVCLLGPN